MIARPSPDQVGWDTIEIEATSAVQAAAIARRQGMTVLEESVRHAGHNDGAGRGGLKSADLYCTYCGYLLEGLSLEARGVTCTECGQFQLLFTGPPRSTDPLPESAIAKGCLQAVVICFALVGLLTVALIALAIF